MATWSKVNYVWENPNVGTPPFSTGMWFLAPADADAEALDALVSLVADAFNDQLKTNFNVGLGAGKVQGTYYGSDGVEVSENSIDAPTADGQTRGAGYSYRVLLEGARPPGARKNAMYWPLPDASLYSTAGVVNEAAKTNFNDWADQLLLDTGDTPFQWRNRHFVDSDGHDASSSSVTGVTTASTVSWLQKRYR